MSDVKGIEVSDVLGLSQPLTKLIETVRCAIGKVYEPVHTKRMAKAKAKEIEIISTTMSDNFNLPVCYDDGTISIDTKDVNDLVIRAQNRFLFQEMKKQQNIECVVSNAYSELEDVNSVSDTPVDEDWISEFFNCVANVSTEKMQILWGKLLAGEVKTPGSFSLRTLEALKRLSTKEANMLKEVAPFVLRCKGDAEDTCTDYFLLADSEGVLLKKNNIPFVKIMLLSDAGLLSENSLIHIGFKLEPSQSETIKGLNESIEITNVGSSAIELRHPAYLLTEAGKELWPIVLTKDDEEKASAYTYIHECLESLKKNELMFMDFQDKDDGEKRILLKIIKN